MSQLQAAGARARLAQGSEGRRLAFVSPKSTHGVLLQLLERDGAPDG